MGEILLICPNCGKELPDEETDFCVICGASISSETEANPKAVQVQKKQPELVFAAAILTLISAALIASVGYIGLYQYISLVDYFGTSASDFEGFLIFGVVCVVSSVVAIAAGMFMLKKKRFTFSLLGIVALIISVIVTYVFTPLSIYYAFDVRAVLLFSEVIVFLLSIISGLFVSNSNAEFN